MFIGEAGCWLVVAVMHGINVLTHKNNSYTAAQSNETNSEHIQVTTAYRAVVSDHCAPEISEIDEIDDAGTANQSQKQHMQGIQTLRLALPAICDICGTTVMNIGLLFTPASLYQMIRGSLVLFVGLFSVIFLKRPLWRYQWAGMIAVILGVAIVGLSGALYRESSPSPVDGDMGVEDLVRIIFGVMLVAIAQCFVASQFVIEEYLLEKWSIEPIKVVGWEGVYGALITAISMTFIWIVLLITGLNRPYGYFNLPQGWSDITSKSSVWGTSIAIMFSIGIFNFCGLSVTRHLTATSRSIFDTLRTLVIWIISLLLGWEQFHFLQLIGFSILVYGTFIFNGILRYPGLFEYPVVAHTVREYDVDRN